MREASDLKKVRQIGTETSCTGSQIEIEIGLEIEIDPFHRPTFR